MTVVLGMGSNLDDRLENLRSALSAIKKIPHTIVRQVSPVYLSDALLPLNAPPDWNRPYLNCAVRCDTTLSPLTLLEHIKNIEKLIGRNISPKRWEPRLIDIDILTFDDLILQTEQLTIPHKNMSERPFALWPLSDVDPLWICPLPGPYQGQTAAELSEQWSSRFTGTAPLHTQQINQRIDMPQLVGILNITPDSFSDGGKFTQTDLALQQALHLVATGADVIDIGAESTAPRANPLTADEEWQRLEPVLMALQANREKFLLLPKISIDTRHAKTANKAINLGSDWINDVTGLQDPAMQEMAAHSKVKFVVMHYLSVPPDRQHILPRQQDPVKLIYEWAMKYVDHLEQVGIPKERIIFDPGIGYGKSPEHSYLLVKQIEIFKQLNTRLLLGYSRKSFMSLFTPHPAHERDVETLAMSLCLAQQSVDYLRVHDVDMCARGLKIAGAINFFPDKT